MGAGLQNDQAMIRRLEFSTLSPILQRRRGLEMLLIIDHACVKSRLSNTCTPGGWCTLPLSGQKLLYLGPSQTSSSYVFICFSVSFIISLNKLVNISISLSSVSFQQINQTWEGAHELLFHSQIEQKLWEPWDLLPMIGVWSWGADVWDWGLNLWSLTPFPSRWCQNWVKL